MPDDKNKSEDQHGPDIEIKPIHELDEKKAVVRVMTDYKFAQQAKAESLNRALRYDAIYQALDSPDDAIDETTGLIEDDESMYSNTFMPIGAAISDSAVAQMFNLIFSTGDYFKLEADDIDDMFFETELTAFFKKRHWEMGFKHKIYDALCQAVCFDYAVTGTRWLIEGGYQPRPVKRVEEVDLAGYKLRKQTVRAEAVWIPDKVDRSDLFVLNFMRCYHDPFSTDGFADSRYFIDDRDVMLETLMQNSKVVHPWGKYKNIEKIAAMAKKGFDDMVSTKDIQDIDERRYVLSSKRVKVIRYWTKHHIIEIANDLVIRRVNTYDWPLQLWKMFPKPNPQFAGMGFLQRLERNQLDINASLNSRRNFQNLVSNPFAVIDQELVAEEEGEPRLYPGKVMVSRGGTASDKIFVYTAGSNTNQDSLIDVQLQTEMTQKVSGVDENAFGTITGDRTTATEVRQAAAGRMTRLGVTTQRLEEQCLEKIYINHFFLEMTFLRKTEFVRYFGDKGEDMLAIDPSSFMWNSIPRFTAMGTFSVLEDAVKMQQFFTALQLAATMPQVEHDWNNIAKQMWRYLHPKDYYKFVKDPTMPQENIPPDIENQLISQGKQVRRSPLNKDPEHIASHEGYKLTPDYQVWPNARKMMLEQHLNEHKAGQQQAEGAPSLSGLLGQQQDGSDPSRGVRPGLLFSGAT